MTARARSAELRPAARASVAAAQAQKLNAFGFFDVDATADAIANKRGLFGYHRRTLASYTLTARTPDGTGLGWADSHSPRLAGVEVERVTTTALRKAVDSQKPRWLDPGKYTVILEPAALEDLLEFLRPNWDARAADEGRSFLSKRGGGNLLGEKVFGENVTQRSDPFEPRLPAQPWRIPSQWNRNLDEGQGVPVEKITWADKGVLKNLAYDRYWAKKTGNRPMPFPSQLILDGGTATLDDLIASTERGLLVTRFWYIRFLQPQTLQLTGLTRDGLFYIEKGKIQYPVMNLRFNQSVVEMLNQIETMTPAVPVSNDLLPAVKVREFNFSSLSDAV